MPLAQTYGASGSGLVVFQTLLEQTCIGNCEILHHVEEQSTAKDFQLAFIGAFTKRRVHLGDGVGGLPIVVSAKPGGHQYVGYTLNAYWKPIAPVGTT
jgi:hypothetical protein